MPVTNAGLNATRARYPGTSGRSARALSAILAGRDGVPARQSLRSLASRGATDMTMDWSKLANDLERLLKLRNPPFGMKLFERVEDMAAIPRIRRPKAVHTFDQVVAQAARLGWTVGVTAEDLVGAQCRAVIGLGNAKDDEWKSGQRMVGVWYSTPDDAGAHQAAMNCVDDGTYQAMVVSPLASGRLDPPDIARSEERRVGK